MDRFIFYVQGNISHWGRFHKPSLSEISASYSSIPELLWLFISLRDVTTYAGPKFIAMSADICRNSPVPHIDLSKPNSECRDGS